MAARKVQYQPFSNSNQRSTDLSPVTREGWLLFRFEMNCYDLNIVKASFDSWAGVDVSERHAVPRRRGRTRRDSTSETLGKYQIRSHAPLLGMS